MSRNRGTPPIFGCWPLVTYLLLANGSGAVAQSDSFESSTASGQNLLAKTGLAKPLPRGAIQRLGGDSNPFLCLAFSPDGKLLASAGYEKAIRLWDVATGQEIRKWIGWEGNYTALAFSPDGRWLASAGLDDRFTHVWEAAIGREVCTLHGLPRGASSVSFSSDGKLVAAGGYHTDDVFLWEVPIGKEVRRLSGPTVPCPEPQLRSDAEFSHVAYAADGKTLASGHLHGLTRIWSTQNFRELRHFRGPVTDSFVHETFSPDGNILATWGSMIRLYSTETWKQLCYFGDQDDLRISAVAFSPDGRMLASGSTGQDTGDQKVHLWEVATGTERCRLDGHRYTVSALAFSPDGSLLVSGSRDGTALVWEVKSLPQNKKGKGQLSEAAMKQHWQELASSDPQLAYRSMKSLIQAPAKSVPLLRNQLRPTYLLESRQISRLIDELDSDRFEVRDSATEQLAGQVELAASVLRAELKEPHSAEARRRMELVLKRWNEGGFSSGQLQTLRAMEVLERVGSAEARSILETLARGTPGFRITHAAQDALARLSRRTGNGPR